MFYSQKSFILIEFLFGLLILGFGLKLYFNDLRAINNELLDIKLFENIGKAQENLFKASKSSKLEIQTDLLTCEALSTQNTGEVVYKSYEIQSCK